MWSEMMQVSKVYKTLKYSRLMINHFMVVTIFTVNAVEDVERWVFSRGQDVWCLFSLSLVKCD